MVQQQTASEAVAIAETASETARDAFVAARRQEILDAARRAFIARGFHATSMQQIAAESGVSAGNIYRYFPSKEALIASVCEGCGEAARQMFASASAKSIRRTRHWAHWATPSGQTSPARHHAIRRCSNSRRYSSARATRASVNSRSARRRS